MIFLEIGKQTGLLPIGRLATAHHFVILPTIMKNILVVEDNDAVALGLRYGLEREGYNVTRVGTVADALAQAPEADLIVLDIRLPDGSGFDICRQLRASQQRQPVLMLTARDEMVDRIIGLEVGADDYMTKPFELRELTARVRALLRRSYGEYASSQNSMIDINGLTIDLSAQRLTIDNVEIHLTSTEFRLLAYLAQNPNQPHSREKLIEDIWGYEQFVGDARTVDVHIRNLRQKVEENAAEPERIVTIRGAGYMLVT